MRQIFISDVHLGAFDDRTNTIIENDLIALIDYCEENSVHLTILGDLFDYWMEYPGYHPELGRRMLKRFKKYNHSVRSILFITGNHDNWTSGYFEKIGFDVESEFRIIKLNGSKILLLHGDGLRNQKFKLPRPIVHQILRHPLFVKFYQFIFSPEAGIRLMKSFSDMSRQRTHFDKKRLNKWAEHILDSYPFDYIISGHDHFQRAETFSGGNYINSGPFSENRCAVYYTKNGFQLVSWNAKEKILLPLKHNVRQDLAII